MRRKGMFDRISAKVEDIRRAKNDLRKLLEEEGEPLPEREKEEAAASDE